MIEFGHGTHVGLQRVRNEDTYYADAALGLFLVADGLGGHRHGEVAAAQVRDAVVEQMTRGRGLVTAIQQAAEDLQTREPRDPGDELPMGTTIAALQLSGDEYLAAWVGDSRIYLWHDGLRQISHDDSLVRSLVDAGQLDAAQAVQNPARSTLTQALGITAPDRLRIGMAGGRLVRGTAFLLCSDGLTEDLDDDALARIVARWELAAQECVDHLLLGALDAGGADNVTAVLVRSS